MTPLRQLQIQVRALTQRIAALEAAQAARKARSKRKAAPPPEARIVLAREALWSKYVLLHVGRHGRVTKLAFAVKRHLNPTEFCRFFSTSDKRGISEGSGAAMRYYAELRDAIAELETRARAGGPVSRHRDDTGFAAQVQ